MSKTTGSEVQPLFEEDLDNLIEEEEKQESLTLSPKKEPVSEKKTKSIISFFKLVPLREYVIIAVITVVFILCFSDYLWTRRLNNELSKLSSSIQEYNETFSQLNVTLDSLNTSLNESIDEMKTTVSQVEEIDSILTHQSIVFRGKVYTVPEPYYVEDGELIDPNTSIHYVITYVDEATLKPFLQPTKQSIYLYIFEMAEIMDKGEDVFWVDEVYEGINNYSSRIGKYPTFPVLSSKEEIEAFLEVIGVSDK